MGVKKCIGNPSSARPSLAEAIIELISQNTETSQAEAVARVTHFYRGNPTAAARAYEIACLVALKRSAANAHPGNNLRSLRPAADLLAIRASHAVSSGDLPLAFAHLKAAVGSGAIQSLCRSVTCQLLRSLPHNERLTVLHYSPSGVEGVEVARVRGAGVILMQAPSAKGGGLIYLRDLGQTQRDSERGSIQFDQLGRSRTSLAAVNWGRYLRDLEAREAS